MFTGTSSNDIDYIYIDTIRAIIDEGKLVSPKNIITKELHPHVIILENPNNNVIHNTARKLNYSFMLAEMLWIISGSGESWISEYNSKLTNFMNEGKLLGAYGPRLRNYGIDGVDQLRKCYEKLKADPYTRQAVAVIYNPAIDTLIGNKDVPCTSLLKFTLRDNKLDLTVYMRSNDIILGFPYDAFNFTSIQRFMAYALNVELGTYYHITDSLHLYQEHFNLANSIVNDGTISKELPFDNADKEFYVGNANDFDSVFELIAKAAILERLNRSNDYKRFNESHIQMKHNMPPFFEFLVDHLSLYVAKKRG